MTERTHAAGTPSARQRLRKQLSEGNDLSGCDYRDQDLSGEDLSEIMLSEARFERARDFGDGNRCAVLHKRPARRHNRRL